MEILRPRAASISTLDSCHDTHRHTVRLHLGSQLLCLRYRSVWMKRSTCPSLARVHRLPLLERNNDHRRRAVYQYLASFAFACRYLRARLSLIDWFWVGSIAFPLFPFHVDRFLEAVTQPDLYYLYTNMYYGPTVLMFTGGYDWDIPCQRNGSLWEEGPPLDEIPL